MASISDKSPMLLAVAASMEEAARYAKIARSVQFDGRNVCPREVESLLLVLNHETRVVLVTSDVFLGIGIDIATVITALRKEKPDLLILVLRKESEGKDTRTSEEFLELGADGVFSCSETTSDFIIRKWIEENTKKLTEKSRGANAGVFGNSVAQASPAPPPPPRVPPPQSTSRQPGKDETGGDAPVCAKRHSPPPEDKGAQVAPSSGGAELLGALWQGSPPPVGPTAAEEEEQEGQSGQEEQKPNIPEVHSAPVGDEHAEEQQGPFGVLQEMAESISQTGESATLFLALADGLEAFALSLRQRVAQAGAECPVVSRKDTPKQGGQREKEKSPKVQSEVSSDLSGESLITVTKISGHRSRVQLNGYDLTLPHKQAELFELLVCSNGVTVAYESIVDKLSLGSKSTVLMRIHHLKLSLHDHAPELASAIVLEYGKGYCFKNPSH